MSAYVEYPSALLEALAAAAERDPGREVCGFVVAGEGELAIWPVENVARDPRTAFEMAPAAVLGALTRIERDGRSLAAVYHSHPGGGAALSSRDLEALVVEGRPLFPGVDLVVVALLGGRACEICVHRWAQGAYRARSVRGPEWVR